jgi:hypothetical protein
MNPTLNPPRMEFNVDASFFQAIMKFHGAVRKYLEDHPT